MKTKAIKMQFQAKVMSRHAITLPANFRQQFNLKPGDVIDFEVFAAHAVLRKESGSYSEASEPISDDGRGPLRDDFTEWENIQRFIEEERRG